MSNNNKWQALSMKDRAFLIREAVRHGITDINYIKEMYDDGGRRIKLGVPYRTLEADSDYDYYNAAPENMPSSENDHWSSRNPHTGQILKSPNHPTYNLAVEGEKQAGYKIQKIGDREYSFPAEHRFDGGQDQQYQTGNIKWNTAEEPFTYTKTNMPSYLWNVFAPIYAKGANADVETIRRNIQTVLGVVKPHTMTRNDPYYDQATGYFDPSTLTLNIHPEHASDGLTYAHEITHILDPKSNIKTNSSYLLPLTQEQEQVLLTGYPSEAVQAVYEQRGVTGTKLKDKVVKEARARNNELRYILYDDYIRQRQKNPNSVPATFDEYIDKMSPYTLARKAKKVSYPNPSEWKDKLNPQNFSTPKIKAVKKALKEIAMNNLDTTEERYALKDIAQILGDNLTENETIV